MCSAFQIGGLGGFRGGMLYPCIIVSIDNVRGGFRGVL
jgi:hypothetical protein